MFGGHAPAVVVVEAVAPLAVVVVPTSPGPSLLAVSLLSSGSVFVIWIILKQEARSKQTTLALPNNNFSTRPAGEVLKIVKYLDWKGGCL